MGLRKRAGKWAYRFWLNGRCYAETTDFDATERNRNAAIREMEDHRRALRSGREFSRRVEVIRFNEAASMFLTWADGEYREHPASARRLRTSFASLVPYFAKTPVSGITEGRIEDFKAWRRTEHQVREVTIRHDLHALSTFFRYALKHRWCIDNPVRRVEIPSDADAVRQHAITPAEEAVYFAACLGGGPKTIHVAAHKRGAARIGEHERTVDTDLRDLHDLGRLMIVQGPRPEEVLALRKEDVDLERGLLHIRRGKSTAARRTLRLLSESRSVLAARMSTDGPWVFPSDRKPGEHLTKLNNAHGRVLEATGLNFVIYDFRHTAATRWAEAGVDLPTIARWLGHANLRTVQRYVHISQEHSDRETERYERYLQSQQAGEGRLGGKAN